MGNTVADSKSECICNIFKDGNESTTKAAFTQKWIELINNMEKTNSTGQLLRVSGRGLS